MNLSNDEILDLFNIGDTLVLNKIPIFWSSTFSKNRPYMNIEAPYTLTIKDIGYSTNNNHVAISDTNGYGWNFTRVVNEDNVDGIINLIRIKKINKICTKQKLVI